MNKRSLLSGLVALLAIVACFLLPPGSQPAEATYVSCPGDAYNCENYWTVSGCEVEDYNFRINQINMCSFDCGDTAPWHTITGVQNVYDVFIYDCWNSADFTIDRHPSGYICESTDVSYGAECSDLPLGP